MTFLALYLRYYPEEWICLAYLLIAITDTVGALDQYSVRMEDRSRIELGGRLGRRPQPEQIRASATMVSWRTSASFCPFGLIWLSLFPACPGFRAYGSRFCLSWLVALVGTCELLDSSIVVSEYGSFFALFTGILSVVFHSGRTPRFSARFHSSLQLRFFGGAWGSFWPIYLLVSRFKDLGVSTLDYLLLLLVLLIPFLPMEQIRQFQLGTIAGGMLVLLWTTEVILRNGKKYWNLVTLFRVGQFYLL